MSRCTINTTIVVIPEDTVIFQDIKHTTHLRENEYSASLLLHARKDLVKNHHFPGIVDKMFISRVWWARLSTLEKVRMIAALAKLHNNVQ